MFANGAPGVHNVIFDAFFVQYEPVKSFCALSIGTSRFPIKFPQFQANCQISTQMLPRDLGFLNTPKNVQFAQEFRHPFCDWILFGKFVECDQISFAAIPSVTEQMRLTENKIQISPSTVCFWHQNDRTTVVFHSIYIPTPEFNKKTSRQKADSGTHHHMKLHFEFDSKSVRRNSKLVWQWNDKLLSSWFWRNSIVGSLKRNEIARKASTGNPIIFDSQTATNTFERLPCSP